MSEPIQYLLCGIPFSGKTTLGRYLVSHLGFVHVNLDEIKKIKGYGQVSDDDVPDQAWPEMIHEADALALSALRDGKNVAHETVWVTKEWRNRARDMAAEEGFQTKVIFLDIPEQVARERQQQNRINKERYDTRDDEFAGYVTEFERPSEDEHVLIYTGNVPVDKWVSDNF